MASAAAITNGEPVTISDSGVVIGEPIPIPDDDSPDAGIPVVEPQGIVIPAETSGETGQRKRRGRPAGSRNVNRAQTSKEVRSDLTGLLLSLHLMGAAITKVPELRIDEDEAKILGDAVARVNREFGVELMSPKMSAIVNLAIAAGTVYGPRAVAVHQRLKTEKAKGKGATDATTAAHDIFTGGATDHPIV